MTLRREIGRCHGGGTALEHPNREPSIDRRGFERHARGEIGSMKICLPYAGNARNISARFLLMSGGLDEEVCGGLNVDSR